MALLLQTSDASSEILRWIDEAGKLRFAQSIQQVPPQYRKQALVQSAEQKDGSFQTYTKSSEHHRSVTSGKYRIPFVAEGTLMRVTAIVNGHLEVPFFIDTGASGFPCPLQPRADSVSRLVQTRNGSRCRPPMERSIFHSSDSTPWSWLAPASKV
jgi:hypothetical protein